MFKPLKNAVSLIQEGHRQICKVKYERLPDWSAVCGYLGHEYKEHGDDIHAKFALVFKELWAESFRGAGPRPGQNCFGLRGSRGGRGRGAGRTGTSRGGASPGEYSETTNVGDTAMIDAEGNRKRPQGENTANTSSVPK
ncbi:hypothetical protein D1007_39895 [Hordeum vulgare]|nr:hypothetical protein D1007_39895 [Hordeum vulgare]